MRQFAVYNLAELLQMTHDEFFELHALAVRVQADHALETVVAGFSALQLGDVEALAIRRGSIFKDDGERRMPLKRISAEEYEIARQLAVEYTVNRQSELPVQEFTLEDLQPKY